MRELNGSRSSPKRTSGRVFWRAGRRKFTIMFIPHTEKKTVHFQMSLFSLIFVSLLIITVFVGFFWFSLAASGREELFVAQSRDLLEIEASLDIIRDEVERLLNSNRNFQDSLGQTRELLGLENVSDDSVGAAGGDLASLFVTEQTDSATLTEVAELKNLRVSMDTFASSLEDLGLALSSQKNLLTDIPTIWPLKGPRGWVTQVFGPSIHPIHDHWYLHRGLDLAFGYGIPIVATANGKVVEMDYDDRGFGYYIIVQHRYGFKTRYAHMQRHLVRLGQEVSQGEVIGTLGNSGMSTGPHLHYEVMIGSQLVDPVKFLNMSDSSRSLQNVSAPLQRYR